MSLEIYDAANKPCIALLKCIFSLFSPGQWKLLLQSFNPTGSYLMTSKRWIKQKFMLFLH